MSVASITDASLLATPERILTRVGLADSVSLHSRKRKLELFLDELEPTAQTTVLDVGADEMPQAGCKRARTSSALQLPFPTSMRTPTRLRTMCFRKPEPVTR